jgi:hypothetical protein
MVGLVSRCTFSEAAERLAHAHFEWGYAPSSSRLRLLGPPFVATVNRFDRQIPINRGVGFSEWDVLL